MRRLVVDLVAATALVIVTACTPDPATVTTIDSTQATIPNQTKIETMSDLCKANEIRGNDRFKGKTITTTGEMYGSVADHDILGTIEVNLRGSDGGLLDCELPRTAHNLKLAATLDDGNVIVVRGVFSDCWLGPELHQCRVLKKVQKVTATE